MSDNLNITNGSGQMVLTTKSQQKTEAESTAQRAEKIGWDIDRVNFFRETHDLYQVANQIDFYNYGHNQAFDDIFVNDFFRSQPLGRFLCIGAANGIDQTRSLLEKGWKGVYCEPDPLAFHHLTVTTREFRDKIVIVNAAITSISGVCAFYISKTIALSTTKVEWSDSDCTSIIINSLAVNQLLDYIGEDFDYVQIDAEGADDEIINSIDWSERLPNCKLIAAEGGINNWFRLWKQGNYVTAALTEHNTYFRKLNLKNE